MTTKHAKKNSKFRVISFNGWLKNMKVIDYGGGTPVHIGAGFSALA